MLASSLSLGDLVEYGQVFGLRGVRTLSNIFSNLNVLRSQMKPEAKIESLPYLQSYFPRQIACY